MFFLHGNTYCLTLFTEHRAHKGFTWEHIPFETDTLTLLIKVLHGNTYRLTLFTEHGPNKGFTWEHIPFDTPHRARADKGFTREHIPFDISYRAWS